MEKFLCGSRYFFSEYEDFSSKDTDMIELVETDEFKQIRQISTKKNCLFQLKKHENKEEYIEWALRSKVPMVVGKFLIPEFVDAIGFTIEDLKRMEPLIKQLDAKHKYEAVIYNAYITNNSFTLTQKQRDMAYRSYKMTRGMMYGKKNYRG